jgi:hypothetical protein
MRHADAELQLWLANDRITREQRDKERARLLRHGNENPRLRQRAGKLVITVGERVAGEPRHAADRRRLAARSS